MTLRAVIASCGMYLPDRVMTNAELAAMVDTSDEWIVQRTGIRERRIAADGQPTSDMAIRAGRQALERGGFVPGDIDCVIVATSTPDTTFPATAVRVQSALGIPLAPAFDLQAVCSGFVYGLTMADSLILSGKARRVLLIGAEKMSSIIDWTDRGTCVLFGDGAGCCRDRGVGRCGRARHPVDAYLRGWPPVGNPAHQRRTLHNGRCRIYPDGRQRSFSLCRQLHGGRRS